MFRHYAVKAPREALQDITGGKVYIRFGGCDKRAYEKAIFRTYQVWSIDNGRSAKQLLVAVTGFYKDDSLRSFVTFPHVKDFSGQPLEKTLDLGDGDFAQTHLRLYRATRGLAEQFGRRSDSGLYIDLSRLDTAEFVRKNDIQNLSFIAHPYTD